LSDISIEAPLLENEKASISSSSSNSSLYLQPAKKRRLSIKNTPSEEILKVEQKIGDGVENICQELQKTNHILSQLTDQLKVSNDLNKQLISWIAYLAQHEASKVTK